jgi:bifunctional non-homologous end joining protein LigD
VVEVKFDSWTNDKIMRAPIFLRLRENKSPKECKIEMEERLTEAVREANTIHSLGIEGSINNNNNNSIRQSITTTATTTTNNQSFSNLDKIFWKNTKDHRELTKRDLIDYYDKISDYILPYLKGRPLSLSRYAEGIKGNHFYHKNWDKEKPDFVQTLKVYSNPKGGTVNYIMCNNKIHFCGL